VIRESDTFNSQLRKLVFDVDTSGTITDCKVSTLAPSNGMRSFDTFNRNGLPWGALYTTVSEVMAIDLRVEIKCQDHPQLLDGMNGMKVNAFDLTAKFRPSSGTAGVLVSDDTHWLFTAYKKVSWVSSVGVLVKDMVCSKQCPDDSCTAASFTNNNVDDNCCVHKAAHAEDLTSLTYTEAQAVYLQSGTASTLASVASTLALEDQLKAW